MVLSDYIYKQYKIDLASYITKRKQYNALLGMSIALDVLLISFVKLLPSSYIPASYSLTNLRLNIM